MTQTRKPSEIMEELAGVAMLAGPDDDDLLKSLEEGLEEIEGILDPNERDRLGGAITPIKDKVSSIRTSKDEDADAAMDRLREEIAELQELVTRGPKDERQIAGEEGRFVLPEWVDEAVFEEFLSGRDFVLDEIEGDILALETGTEEALFELRGRIHSLKGGSGIIGLAALEAACHAIEDYLDRDDFPIDRLFMAKDWIADALTVYADGKIPDLQSFLDQLNAPFKERAGSKTGAEEGHASNSLSVSEDPTVSPIGGDSKSDGDPELADRNKSELEDAAGETPDYSQEDSPDPVECVKRQESLDWDGDMLEIFAGFLEESAEGLTDVDGILMGFEEHGSEISQVDAMFRVFHTIKGVSGFLELEEITQLAHTTENLLDLARKGQMVIDGASLDLLFDVTELIQRMLKVLRKSVADGLSPPSEPALPLTLQRIRESIEACQLSDKARQESEQALVQDKDIDEQAVDLLTIEEEIDDQKIGAHEVAQRAKEAGAEAVSAAGGQDLSAKETISQSLATAKKAEHKVIREVVKVDLERVDNLVALIGELVIVESMIANSEEMLNASSPHLRKQLNHMSKITRDVQDIGMRMRMVPVGGLFQKMSRMVRDLSRTTDKQVSVHVSGEGTEMDRSMVEHLGDPMVHMIRNAVDHGIEREEDRHKADKSPRGTICLRAYYQGGSVVVEVEDDGKGLDRDVILAKAVERGIVDKNAKMTDQEVFSLIFAPGFSTAKQVTEVSGRGVGMDVVARSIEAIRGRVQIDSVLGKGTKFTIVIPLTLAIIDGMLVMCGEECYIIPTLSVVESIQPDASMVFTVAGQGEIVSLRGDTFPLYRLDRLLGVAGAKQDATKALVVVIECRARKMGILVDDILTQQQVVIKSLGDGLGDSRYLSGAAIMSDGRVGLIINTDEIATLIERSAIVDAGAAEEEDIEIEVEQEKEEDATVRANQILM